MKILHNIRIPYSKNPDLKSALLSQGIKENQISSIRILKQSLDARAKPKLFWVFSLEVFEKGEVFPEQVNPFQKINKKLDTPLIIGCGPAGLFAAWTFLQHGIKPILFERGSRTHPRMLKISQYWRHGKLDPNSNVCFGEGGAGTFSDGKLITRIKSPLIDQVLNALVSYGAPSEITYSYNPHVGSNLIREVIKKMSDDLINQGASLHFDTEIESLNIEKNCVTGVHLRNGEKIKGDGVFLASGHSASEFMKTLYQQGIKMEAKAFAMGLRIEHPQAHINQWQYGKRKDLEELPSAQYKMTHYWEEEKIGVYSFCMCPGGYVIASSTHPETIVINGMSNYHRNSPWANSAIVCSIGTHQIEGDPVFKMLQFQEEVEKKTYALACEVGESKKIPAQRLEDFLNGRLGKIPEKSSCPSGIIASDLSPLFPSWIYQHLCEGILDFNKRRPGFAYSDALLHAVESRTSSPLKIPRDPKSFESISHENLYPCGEGPGYAGGITSAAVDGMNAALAWIEKRRN